MQRKITGIVVHGKKLGSKLGFPTANLALEDTDQHPDGVYAVRVTAEGKTYGGVANIGTRPTVTADKKRFLEAYLFDFTGNLYGKTIAVELLACLRPELKFASVEALRKQIETDKTEAERFLKNLDK